MQSNCGPGKAVLVLGVFVLTPFMGGILDAALAQGSVSVDRGLQVSITSGCQDCHTQGYSQAEGKVDPANAMKGSSIGLRGPWGTTYPSNLRFFARMLSEDTFVITLKHLRTPPPMPWYNLRVMDESDIRSLYRYIKSLGVTGSTSPDTVPPDKEPKTPYIQLAPPRMPKVP